MIGVPMAANSIYIPTVQTGCCKAELDPTYPIHLNGIISQYEFQESIGKINSTIGNARRYVWIMMIIFFIGIFISMACFMIGAAVAGNADLDVFLPLIGVGTGLSVVNSIVFIIVLIIIRVRYTARLREVVAAESMKYSTRSPVPCSWRLDTAGAYFGGYGYNRNMNYNVVIDIGRPAGADAGTFYSNPGSYQSPYSVGQQNQYSTTPPPYSSSSTAFCSKCGATRQDASARFCPSCGQAFNKS